MFQEGNGLNTWQMMRKSPNKQRMFLILSKNLTKLAHQAGSSRPCSARTFENVEVV